MEAVQNMARKYRVRPPEIADIFARCESRLAELGGSADIDALLVREQQAEAIFTKAAAELSAQRKKAAKKLAQSITAAMQTLAMQGGQFTIDLEARKEPNANGNEQVVFCVAGHAGVKPGPLDKVASGGELSRIGLALQVVMSKVARVPTLIFDEVDAGIGGGVAEVVGQLLRNSGSSIKSCALPICRKSLRRRSINECKQDHATRGYHKFGQFTRRKDRIDEIARMLGGVKITDTTRKHAAEMLSAPGK